MIVRYLRFVTINAACGCFGGYGKLPQEVIPHTPHIPSKHHVMSQSVIKLSARKMYCDIMLCQQEVKKQRRTDLLWLCGEFLLSCPFTYTIIDFFVILKLEIFNILRCAIWLFCMHRCF